MQQDQELEYAKQQIVTMYIEKKMDDVQRSNFLMRFGLDPDIVVADAKANGMYQKCMEDMALKKKPMRQYR